MANGSPAGLQRGYTQQQFPFQGPQGIAPATQTSGLNGHKPADIGAHRRVVEAVRQLRQEQAGSPSSQLSPAEEKKLEEKQRKQLQQKLRESAKSQGKGAAKVSVLSGDHLSKIRSALEATEVHEALYDLMKQNRWSSITLIDGQQVSTIYRQDLRHEQPRYLSSKIDDTSEPDTTLKPFNANDCEALLRRLFQVGQTPAVTSDEDEESTIGDGLGYQDKL